jgi:hypothetical protein
LRADRAEAVLKLIVLRDADVAAHEATVRRLAAGEGCARLLRADVGRGALLLEPLGRSLFELQLPTRRRHEILVSAANAPVLAWASVQECHPTTAPTDDLCAPAESAGNTSTRLCGKH